MKISKAANKSKYTTEVEQSKALVPMDEEFYPVWHENYMRLYVRARFIVYVEYSRIGDVLGYVLAYEDQSGPHRIMIRMLPGPTMFDKMEIWCDNNDGNPKFNIIAR